MKKSAHRKMVSTFIFFVPEGRKNFPFQKTFPKNIKIFLNSEKFCRISRSFLVLENYTTIIEGSLSALQFLPAGR